MGLPNWDKADSEDICFVPQGDYRKVVEKVVPSDALPGTGDITDQSGKVLGQHDGIHHFTVGQRKGLKIASRDRLYVLSVDSELNRVTVGQRQDLSATGLKASECRWIAGCAPNEARSVTAKIRYGHGGVPAEVMTVDDRAIVRFETPQDAISPGQAVVFYEGERVLGGGWIDEAGLSTAARHQSMPDDHHWGRSGDISHLGALALKFGYAPGVLGSLEQAVTHKSFSNEALEPIPHNERLEFLGDAVIDLIIAEALMVAHPEAPEGILSSKRAAIVNSRSLAEVAQTVELGRVLRLGRGEQLSGGRRKDLYWQMPSRLSSNNLFRSWIRVCPPISFDALSR